MNASLIKLVTILSDGHYHDGTSIGAQLNITRSAVWKMIRKLQDYKIKINSVKGKGYVLAEPFIILDLAEINKKLEDKNLEINLFESINSTNDYLKVPYESKNTVLCLAEQQTAGKGRLGRKWHSPFGRNLYLSGRYFFRKDVSELAGLSLLTSLAVIAALKSLGCNEEILVKWPNDVFYQHRKISGTLIEIQAESHGGSFAVIGIGINANMIDDDPALTSAWISVQKIMARYIDRNELAAHLINHLLSYLAEFDLHGFAPFVEMWGKRDYLRGQVVTLKNAQHEVRGRVLGVNEQGYLRLELSDGSVRAFSSGDASIIR